MCGIAGYVGQVTTDSKVLHTCMRMAIRYRGRDGEGEWSRPGVVHLFHARLSIIDLEGGAQPMVDGSGRYIIVFNGEIYNYLELRKAYSEAGAQFHTNSDTEVILEGYKLKGTAVCSDLNGMFAFAIWDNVERRLFLARDRLGKKPLYWTDLGGRFYFASSLDAFRAIPGWTAQLSRLNLDAYAALGSFLPGETAFRQGRSLPPASYAIIERGAAHPSITTYWKLDFSGKFSGTLDSAIEQFEALMADAIAIRLRADVPVALTFSGGVDSGIIAALAKHRLGQSLSCWTIDYHTDDDPSEETGIAKQVADLLGLEWHYRNFDYHRDLLPALREALQEADQPCGHIAISYSRRLYAAIRSVAKVVLTGNGADELFLGYNGNEDLSAKDWAWRAAPQRMFLRRWWSRAFSPASSREMELADYQTAYVRTKLRKYQGEDEPEEKVQRIRQNILESNISSHVDLYTYMSLCFYTGEPNFRIPDITGLAEQVEVRSPFLDYRVVEFAAQLPTVMKIGSPQTPHTNKLLLKRYYQRYVPEEVAFARKKGMGANLRYDRSIAANPALHDLYGNLLARIDAAGLPEEAYRQAWEEFVRDKQVGIESPPSAGTMSAGLMLGLWLDRIPDDARGAV